MKIEPQIVCDGKRTRPAKRFPALTSPSVVCLATEADGKLASARTCGATWVRKRAGRGVREGRDS